MRPTAPLRPALLGVWIRQASAPLIVQGAPRAAFFTFVFPAVLLVFVDGTAERNRGRGGRPRRRRAVLHAFAGRLRALVRLLHEPGLLDSAGARAGILKRVRGTPCSRPSTSAGDRGRADAGIGSVALWSRSGSRRSASPVPGADSGGGRHADRRAASALRPGARRVVVRRRCARPPRWSRTSR